MSTAKAKAPVKQSKKERIAAISGLLSGVLSEFKKSLGEKKFEKRIKKAARLFADEIRPVKTKKAPVKAAKAKVIAKKK